MENTENHIRRGEGWIQEEEQGTWPDADVQLRMTTMTPANTNICDPVKDGDAWMWMPSGLRICSDCLD